MNEPPFTDASQDYDSGEHTEVPSSVPVVPRLRILEENQDFPQKFR